MDFLRRIKLNGFKSIKKMDLELCSLNVLVGANGAGKSNFVSFFKMLGEIISGHLQQFISANGQAHALLCYGPKVTQSLEVSLEFGNLSWLASYHARFYYAAGDTLGVAEETLRFSPDGGTMPRTVTFSGGNPESRIVYEAVRGDEIAEIFHGLLRNIRVYHFHDTSATARVRQYGYVGNSGPLLSDAGNLAAVLYGLRNEDHGATYERIVSTIRLVAPFFHDFALEPAGPNGHNIILNWQETDSDEIFGPHQISDGTLRAICLITLLLQPEPKLPHLIFVDEPELGLHPYALNLIASLFKKASHHCQVIVSTQSTAFLDHFDAEDIIVVDRKDKESVFSRPDPAALEAWLEEYSLGEVWEKNVIGGGPH